MSMENPYCGDSSCEFATKEQKTGQRTNGGCRCLADLPSPRRQIMQRYILTLRAENARLTKTADKAAKQIADLEKNNEELNDDLIRVMNERNEAEERGAREMAECLLSVGGPVLETSMEGAMCIWRASHAGR